MRLLVLILFAVLLINSCTKAEYAPYTIQNIDKRNDSTPEIEDR